MDLMYVPPQNPYVEALMSNVPIFGKELGKHEWGNKNGALIW